METRSRKRAEASSSSSQAPPTTSTTTTSNTNSSSSSQQPPPTPAPLPSSTTHRQTQPQPQPQPQSQPQLRPQPQSQSQPQPQPQTQHHSRRPSKRSRTSRQQQHQHQQPSSMDDGPPPFRHPRDTNKGKEKEKDRDKDHHHRHKDHRSNVIDDNKSSSLVGLSLDPSNNDDDDDDAEDGNGAGILHQNFTSASSALQGLLRKLGAGLDDLLPAGGGGGSSSSSSSHQGGRLKRILAGLRADGEEGKQVESLTQLCDMLSIGTEDSLGSFSVDSFVPVLVGLLNHETNPDIMLLAARALTHLCDVLPSSCAAVVHYGAVSCFCARLLTIEYMDLAEQSLQALKKISQEHPTACLRAGALMAVLSYLDFFSTGVQRVALSTAANMCKKLPSDAADYVMEAVPLLTNLLHYHDSKVLDLASVCLTRIAEAFASSSDKLDELCNHGLISQAAGLISVGNSGGGQASLSTSTYTGLIHLLATFASGSALGAKSLHLLGISGILKEIISGSGIDTSISVSPTLTRPPEQIFELVKLADELLPPLPQGTISLPISFHSYAKGSSGKRSAVNIGTKQDGDLAAHDISAREKLLVEQPELLQQFGMDLLPVLIQMYGSSVNAPVRHKCLSVLAKLMFFSTADMIQSLLGATNIASFLAGILAWKDPQVLIPALQIAEILMEKLPGTFSKVFVREGVVHAVDALIISESSGSASVLPVPSEKDNDSSGTSRSRRYRRRTCSSHTDATVEEQKSPSQGTVGSGSAEIPSATSSLRKSVSTCAKAFKDKYFSSDNGATEIGVSDDLIHLKNLCTKLNVSTEGTKSKAKGKSKASVGHSFETSPDIEEQLCGYISEILGELSKGDGVSTFEFIGSGVILAFLNYYSCGTFSKEKISEVNLPKLRQQSIKRFKSFINLALPMTVKEGAEPPMTVLVRKLQGALISLERFPVVLSHASRQLGGSSRLSSGLGFLSQPFKLRLCRAHGDKSLRDYSSNIVLIDPLATLAAVEEFLWPRVQRSESGQKSSAGNNENGAAVSSAVASPPTSLSASGVHRHGTRSRSPLEIGGTGRKDLSESDSTVSKGKGKAVLKPTSNENKGPQTRSAARRRAVSDKDAPMKSEHAQSSSEEEDLDISPAEIDDALVIEDDDVSEDEVEDHDEVLRYDSLPLCMPEKVHDVKLGDPAEDGGIASSTSDSRVQPSSGSSTRVAHARGTESVGGSFGSRGAMSFAAAAMAGLTSVSGRGFRSGRDRRGFPLGYSPNDPPRLLFYSCGKPLSRNLTIYQAIHRQLLLNEDEDDSSDFLPTDGSRLWSDIFTITYRKADGQTDQGSTGGSTSSHQSRPIRSVSALSSANDSQWKQVSLLDSILQGELPCDLDKSNCTYNILALLRVLEGLNQLAPRLRYQSLSDDFVEGRAKLEIPSISGLTVSSQEFVNSKLTPKLTRQMQDALALCSGSLPSWCHQLTKACPFLFPFETRRQFFYSTAFGLSRALHRLQQQAADAHSSSNAREVRLGRLQRQKVRVSRNRILDSATKVMDMYSSQKAVLEVEYFGEVGTGLGPTLEFYTLVSHELQKSRLQMWRSSSAGDKSQMDIDNYNHVNQSEGATEAKRNPKSAISRADNFIEAPLGLFPRPWPPNADLSAGTKFSKVIEYFRLMGQAMAKALQDGRLLDLPLSVAFYKMVLGQELDLHDILSFDSEFGKTLLEMQLLVYRKKYLEANNGCNGLQDVSELCFRGIPIEDLYLDFTLPGSPGYVLKEGGENMLVSLDSLEEYISLVVDATVKIGISRQLEALRSGFNQVFDIASLQIFSPDELDYLLCGRRELWKAETLVDYIKFDHGYTAKSPAIVNLLEIMGDFAPEQQRAFCQFVTGAPSLPPGGLAALNPKLTIVRKHSSTATVNTATGTPESADEDLPSVMTCANYLKLPPYSTKEVMYTKLLYAINEGQGSFDLS